MPAGTPSFIGKRLLQVREARQMTAKSLVEALSVSNATISAYEHNKQTPPYSIVERLSLMFKVPMNFFTSEYFD
jgi:transcriptional regulator with XRE-family HTH domain